MPYLPFLLHMKRLTWDEILRWILKVQSPPSSQIASIWIEHSWRFNICLYLLVLVVTGSTNVNFSGFTQFGHVYQFVVTQVLEPRYVWVSLRSTDLEFRFGPFFISHVSYTFLFFLECVSTHSVTRVISGSISLIDFSPHCKAYFPAPLCHGTAVRSCCQPPCSRWNFGGKVLVIKERSLNSKAT